MCGAGLGKPLVEKRIPREIRDLRPFRDQSIMSSFSSLVNRMNGICALPAFKNWVPPLWYLSLQPPIGTSTTG